MPPAVDLVVVVLIRNGGRDRDDPRPEASDRQANLEDAFALCATDNGAPAK